MLHVTAYFDQLTQTTRCSSV